MSRVEGSMGYAVAQLGARMHYAVPRILHARGQLTQLFTDIAANKGWLRLCRRVPEACQMESLRRILGRLPVGIPPERVTAFNQFGLRYAYRCRQARSASQLARAFLWAGETFCKHVLRRGIGDAEGIYLFNSAGLELLEGLARSGLHKVLEQTIAPRRIEQQLMRVEQATFGDWMSPVEEDPAIDAYCDREEAEWRLADLILCGSPFVKQGIGARGGPEQRCIVMPYGIDDRYCMSPRESRDGPLRVLTVGGIGLRKGSPYVLSAARVLKGVAQFRMVGAIEASPAAAAMLREVLELTGPVPRSDMRAHFAWADVFLLPSLCEGSATVVYEALSAALPVICTESAGSVVRDGLEGVVVPIRDSDAIGAALERLAKDPALRREMGEQAERRARSFGLADYGQRLVGALKRIQPVAQS
jgi:glycosyltransferase involved in cell wall biosynthesis